jgi:uroporphyrinogen decarboxylase
MNSRERVRLALSHKEADRVPLDIAGTGISQVQLTAYRKLRNHLRLAEGEPRVRFVIEQLAWFENDIADRLAVDTAFVIPQAASDFEYVFRDEGDYEAFTDEWGIGWRKPKKGGFYYDMYSHPLAAAETLADFRAYKLPDPLDDQRYQNLRSEAQAAVKRGKAVVVGPGAGLLEIYAWMRGYEQFYIDLALNQDMVAYMLDRLLAYKQVFWERILAEVGDQVDVACEHDDLAGQKAMLFSPETYRTLIKPRHKKLFDAIKAQTEAKLFFHTDGAVRPVIGDLIDAGMDILNPVQFTAVGMELKGLKQDFGRDITFWGAGVDTQGVLGTGTPEEVRADVKRNIEALAPGGGFVFATVHNIQADVPPENIMAMWEAWHEYGGY